MCALRSELRIALPALQPALRLRSIPLLHDCEGRQRSHSVPLMPVASTAAGCECCHAAASSRCQCRGGGLRPGLCCQRWSRETAERLSAEEGGGEGGRGITADARGAAMESEREAGGRSFSTPHDACRAIDSLCTHVEHTNRRTTSINHWRECLGTVPQLQRVFLESRRLPLLAASCAHAIMPPPALSPLSPDASSCSPPTMRAGHSLTMLDTRRGRSGV